MLRRVAKVSVTCGFEHSLMSLVQRCVYDLGSVLKMRSLRETRGLLDLRCKQTTHDLVYTLVNPAQMDTIPDTHSPSSNVAFWPPIFSFILLNSCERSWPDLSLSLRRLDRDTDRLGGDFPGEKLVPNKLSGIFVVVRVAYVRVTSGSGCRIKELKSLAV